MSTLKIVQDIFNSDVFGIKMGNLVSSDNYEYTGLDKIIAKAIHEGFVHLTCKIPTSEKKMVNELERNGFCIADTLVTYCFKFDKSRLPDMMYKCSVGDCKLEDVEELKRISRKSFKIDRFHSDENLPNELCDLYYEKWFENSFSGFANKINVAYYEGSPVGYTTGKYDKEDKYIHLVLSAVDETKRGLGIYTTLIHSMTRWAIELKREEPFFEGILLGTQIDNIAVQKAWSKLGYAPYGSEYVMQITI